MPTTANAPFITYNWRSDYTEEFGPDGSRIVSIVDTPWTADNIFSFPGAMAGRNSLAGRKFFRDLPEQHPGKAWFNCTEVRLLNGQGALTESGGMLRYVDGGNLSSSGFAVWEVVWEPLQYSLVDDASTYGFAGGSELGRFVERLKRFSCESMPLPGQFLKWASDNETIRKNMTLGFPLVELRYRQWFRPEPLPESVWGSKLDKVNTGSFDSHGIDADPQTVLFKGWDTVRLRDAAQNKVAHVDFIFLWRPKLAGMNDGGWNAFYRPQTGLFQKIVATTDGSTPPYALAGGTDLDGIFGATG